MSKKPTIQDYDAAVEVICGALLVAVERGQIVTLTAEAMVDALRKLHKVIERALATPTRFERIKEAGTVEEMAVIMQRYHVCPPGKCDYICHDCIECVADWLNSAEEDKDE